MRQAHSIPTINQTTKLNDTPKNIPTISNNNIKKISPASEYENIYITYCSNILLTQCFEMLNKNRQTRSVSNTKNYRKVEADTKEVNYHNFNTAINNITKIDNIISEAKTYISPSNIRYNSSTNQFQSTRQRIKRQLKNTKQTKIVSANRITKLFNNRDDCTNFVGNYGRSFKEVHNTTIIQSTRDRSKSHIITLSPQLKSHLIHTKLI